MHIEGSQMNFVTRSLKKISKVVALFQEIIIINEIVQLIPSHSVRLAFYRKMGMSVGKGSRIYRKCYLQKPDNIIIGENCIIGFFCNLDGRGKLRIGNNVNISSYTILVTGSHDFETFKAEYKPITINDNVWICTRSTILQGVTIGEGAIVAAGSVVTKNVPPYVIVAGSPAKPVGKRSKNIRYKLSPAGIFQ